MTVDTDAVMVVAAMIFVSCMASYLGLFLWGRKLDRESRRETDRFERALDEVLRR